MGRLLAWMMMATLAVMPAQVYAQAQTQFIINGAPATGGTSGNTLQISSDQKLMLEAAKKVVSNDYPGAEALYNQAISMNGGNMDAYLQRGIVRRELGNDAGAQADGRMVVNIANSGLQAAPNDANLYYHRGMGLRLLKDFGGAKADVSKAIQMSGQLSWKTDLQAIELEARAFQ